MSLVRKADNENDWNWWTYSVADYDRTVSIEGASFVDGKRGGCDTQPGRLPRTALRVHQSVAAAGAGAELRDDRRLVEKHDHEERIIQAHRYSQKHRLFSLYLS